MSSVERGHGGVWSCIYCEGAWLPQAQAAKLLLDLQPRFSQPIEATTSASAAALVCPSCHGNAFLQLTPETSRTFQCSACRSLYFAPGALAAVAPQAVSVGGEAPVLAAIAGALASVLLCDPMPLLVALQAERPSARVA